MATLYELEQQLKEAKEKERIEALNKQLEENIKLYKGKCYATHLLGRGWNKNITCNVRRVVDVRLNSQKTEVEFELDTFGYVRTAEPRPTVRYESSRHITQSVKSWWESFRHEITESQFMAAKKKVEANVDIIGESIREGMRVPDDYINGVTQTEDMNHMALLTGCKIPLITLPTERTPNNNTSIAEMLGWYHHPMVYGGKVLINCQYSKCLLEQIIRTLSSNMHSWGGSIYSRDAPRVEALTNFLNSTKWIT